MGSRAIRQQIARLDPEADCEQIVQLTLRDCMLWDVVRSLELALFRTFASPPVGSLLARTGEFDRNGQKRYDDTSLLLLNILRDGLDGTVGSAALERMNRTHAHYNIANEDFLFVLSTFVIDPIWWIDRFGWRRSTTNERQALFHVWRRIGQRMGLQDIPQTLDEMRSRSDAYVRERSRHTPENESVGRATIRIAQGWVPAVLRPLAPGVVASLLDERTRTSMGLKRPNSLLRGAVLGSLKLRALGLRLIRPLLGDRDPNWPDGRRSYPGGYTVDWLAPDRLRAAERKRADRAA